MHEIDTFRFLWKMVNEIWENEHRTYKGRPVTGTIVSRYAHILDDRLENSGHSRSVDSLTLYTNKQLKDELVERKTATPKGNPK